MRVYIAAPWKHRDEAQRVGEKFEQAGHKITEKWWDHVDVGQDQMASQAAEMARQAKSDRAGVFAADHFIFLNLGYSEGKCVELGMALSEGVPIIAVGERSMNVFHYLPEVKWVGTVEEALERIQPEGKKRSTNYEGGAGLLPGRHTRGCTCIFCRE